MTNSVREAVLMITHEKRDREYYFGLEAQWRFYPLVKLLGISKWSPERKWGNPQREKYFQQRETCTQDTQEVIWWEWEKKEYRVLRVMVALYRISISILLLPYKVWGWACARSCFVPVMRRQPSAWPLPSLIKASSHQTYKNARTISFPVRTTCTGELLLPPLTSVLRRSARKTYPIWRAWKEPEDFWASRLVSRGPVHSMVLDRSSDKHTLYFCSTSYLKVLGKPQCRLCTSVLSRSSEGTKVDLCTCPHVHLEKARTSFYSYYSVLWKLNKIFWSILFI